MAKSQRLRLWELRGVTDLIGEIGELGANPTAWRTHALQGLIRLVGGQVAMTADLAGAVPNGIPRPIDPIDVGWTDQATRQQYYDYYLNEIVDDPGANAIMRGHTTTNFLTVFRQQIIDDETWYAAMAVSELRRSGGVDDFACSTVSWAPGWMQGFVVYRPWGAPRFDVRQRRLMRLCHLGLLRLYRSRRNANGMEKHFQDLPPRVTQTLSLLLAGHTLKETAAKIGISFHTANDYAKVLYRRLKVNSRGELLSKCLSRRAPTMALPIGMDPPPWPIGDDLPV
jgi:DNA-binding CsgD family transcriptional regulator